MILRNFGVRHGRQALANPSLRPWTRVQQFSDGPIEPRTSTPPARPTVTETAIPTSDVAAGAAPADVVAEATEAVVTPAFNYPNPERDAAEARKEAAKAIPRNFHEFQFQKKDTKKIGATLESLYLPDEVLRHPPSDASLEDLMAAQCHMGHNKASWNPANGRYVFGERDGIHIISLETTQTHLRRAARVVEEVAYHGGLILFAGTRPGQMPIVVRMAELAGACHLFQKWTPGTITNRDTLLAGGILQIVDEKDRPLPGFEKHLMERRPVIPDLVICLNPLENYTLLKECGMANIPTIGIIDTDADPTRVTYQIPANDDSLRSVALIAGVLAKAGQRGQVRRHEDADKGIVTWQTPHELEQFINRDYKEKISEMEKSLTKETQTEGDNEVMSAALESVRNQLRSSS